MLLLHFPLLTLLCFPKWCHPVLHILYRQIYSHRHRRMPMWTTGQTASKCEKFLLLCGNDLLFFCVHQCTDKPRLVASSNPDPVDVHEGNPLELNCSAVGQPSPSYTWTLPKGVTSHTTDSVLTIKSTTTEDKGEYTCTVNNSVGSVTVSFNVNVQGKVYSHLIFRLSEALKRNHNAVSVPCASSHTSERKFIVVVRM